ncbi:MAG: pilus assembly protein [Hyphomonadaceae bacterium]|nr:pilus assembly protein [Hyphomonadaceae bacterium]
MKMFSLKRALRDKRGLAALEFALMAPMMVLILFGSIELTELMATNRRAENTTASLADVVSRDTVITNAELTDLWAAAGALMYPNTATPMQMRISSVQVQTATEARVLWSDGYGGYAPRAAGSTFSLPSGMMVPGTSVVVAETSYRYNPPIGVFLDLAFDLKHVEYRRPRIADPVTRN